MVNTNQTIIKMHILTKWKTATPLEIGKLWYNNYTSFGKRTIYDKSTINRVIRRKMNKKGLDTLSDPYCILDLV